jgi:AcrR family transcriptional regulator
VKSADFVFAPVARRRGPAWLPAAEEVNAQADAPGTPAAAQLPESLRARKKRLTRTAIFEAAQRLFAERGFDDVTVAQIADAANISVKTLFTYVRSKEELVFGGGPTMLDAVVAAVRDRRIGETPLVAAAMALLAAAGDAPAGQCGQSTTGNSKRAASYSANSWPATGLWRADGARAAGRGRDSSAKAPAQPEMTQLATFCRMAQASPEAASRLRALWDETEDALAAVLAGPSDGPRERAARRLEAAQIMVLVRTVTSQEVAALIAGAQGARASQEALREWIRDAAGSLARGLQATRR